MSGVLPRCMGAGPKYKALAEAYADMIDNGEIKAGTKLPSLAYPFLPIRLP